MHHSTHALFSNGHSGHTTKSLLSKAIDSYVAYINCEPQCPATPTKSPQWTHRPSTFTALMSGTKTTTTTPKPQATKPLPTSASTTTPATTTTMTTTTTPATTTTM